MNTSFLQELLNSVAERGRHLLPWALSGDGDDIVALSRALMSGRGEASGVAIAREIIEVYRGLDDDGRRTFFQSLAHGFEPDAARVAAAARDYLKTPSSRALADLQKAVESPRQEFFRRLNLAPNATAEIVAMRRNMLTVLKDLPELRHVDADLRHLLGSWFNRGFLVMRRIDWRTPAVILEKIIAYEAVHEIKGWDDLRRRLDPTDRRCYAFFHPSLVDEPLIFVEIALTQEPSASIDEVLRAARIDEPGDTARPSSGQPPPGQPPSGKRPPGKLPTTAVFYSISNCQEGLRGISFGNFLIKQVVEDLVREIPSLTTFVTLSPIPRFAGWLDRVLADANAEFMTPEEHAALAGLSKPDWILTPAPSASMKAPMLALAARYFLEAKAADGRPIDPVARFHLGNGARLDRINWRADTSAKGLREAYGLMVNYHYELKEIEANHEAFANEGRLAVSRAVRTLARAGDRRRRAAPRMLEPPKDAAKDAPRPLVATRRAGEPPADADTETA